MIVNRWNINPQRDFADAFVIVVKQVIDALLLYFGIAVPAGKYFSGRIDTYFDI
jgi:hypothetical protein